MTRIDQRLGVSPGVAAGRNSASHDPSASISTWRGLHVRSWPATTGPPRSPRPAATTGTRRTRDRRAATSPARSRSTSISASVDLRRRVGADLGVEDGVRPALGQRHQPGLRERRPFTLVHPRTTEARRRSRRCRRHRDVVPSIATSRRPASHAPGVVRRRQRRARPARTTPSPARTPTGPGPGRSPTSTATSPAPTSPTDHDNPSVNNANTSSYEPSECNAIPIAKYAITRAGNDRCRCSVRPASAITSSTTSGGNTRVSNPTDTRSDNRRSDSGFTQPARGTHPNYTAVVLTERYWV